MAILWQDVKGKLKASNYSRTHQKQYSKVFKPPYEGAYMKKPLLIALAIAASSLSFAQAQSKTTPAEDLVKQASFYIGFYYNGNAKVPYWRELQKNMITDVQKLCAGDTNCGYDKGRQVIVNYMKSLNDPFTRLVSVEDSETSDRYANGKGPSTPTIGIQARELQGQGLVVLEAFPGEPAFNADLSRGNLIKTINGSLATLDGLKTAEASGKAISLEYTVNGAVKTASVTAALIEDPRAPYRSSVRDALVIRIPHLYGEIGTRVHANVARAVRTNASGVIIDLRDSFSGYDSEALLAAGAFIKEGGFTYDQRFAGQDSTYFLEKNGALVRGQPEGQDAQDIAQASNPVQYTGKVVVLVNQVTENSSEMLAYFLQRVGRAKVVGVVTSGQNGVSGGGIAQLINDDVIQVSTYRMLNLDKSPFPMAVTPDVIVPEDLAALAAGRDVQLEKALELIGAK
jgi:carboxyl-terminal processing protease